MMRSIAHWAPIVLLVGLSVLGLQSAIDELGSASTLGQRAATATQFGLRLTTVPYALASVAVDDQSDFAIWMFAEPNCSRAWYR